MACLKPLVEVYLQPYLRKLRPGCLAKRMKPVSTFFLQGDWFFVDRPCKGWQALRHVIKCQRIPETHTRKIPIFLECKFVRCNISHVLTVALLARQLISKVGATSMSQLQCPRRHFGRCIRGRFLFALVRRRLPKWHARWRNEREEQFVRATHLLAVVLIS